MAFPTTPVNGQIYITSDGRRYVYDLTSDSWSFLGDKSVIKNNLTATVAPTNLDGSTLGYTEGSIWIDRTNDKPYYLVDSTIGLAKWVAAGGATVSNALPPSPTLGQISFNNTNNTVYIWDGSVWVNTTAADGNGHHVIRADAVPSIAPTVVEVPLPTDGDTSIVFLTDGKIEFWSHNATVWSLDFTQASGSASATVSATAPPTPSAGDIWYNSTTDIVFIYNGTTWVDIVSAGSGPVDPVWQSIIAAHTAISGEHLALDSTGGVFTVTLPVTPTSNDVVYLVDIGQAMVTNNVTIARNGSTIQGLASDLIINTNNKSFALTYIAASWRIT